MLPLRACAYSQPGLILRRTLLCWAMFVCAATWIGCGRSQVWVGPARLSDEEQSQLQGISAQYSNDGGALCVTKVDRDGFALSVWIAKANHSKEIDKEVERALADPVATSQRIAAGWRLPGTFKTRLTDPGGQGIMASDAEFPGAKPVAAPAP